MTWKFLIDLDAATDLREWDEMIGKSPWDYVTAPNWPGADAEDPWDFRNQYLEASANERDDGQLSDMDPDDSGAWEFNPLTGVKVWIPNR